MKTDIHHFCRACLALTFALSLGVQPAVAQAQDKLTQEDITTLLEAGSSSDEIVTELNKRGYSGATDATALTALKKAGANVSLLLAVRKAVAGGAASPTTTPAPTAAATETGPFVNTLGMKFVPVPGTNVLFCIHETRKGDYAAYARANTGVDDSWKNAKTLNGIPVSPADDHPVVHVFWKDAKAFCEWLSRKEGRKYRLPTDREWSVAAGIGELEGKAGTPESKSYAQATWGEYPWGRKWPPHKVPGNYMDVTAYQKGLGRFGSLQTYLHDYTDGYATTSPVMSYAPTHGGLFDMGGNVKEWCEDWYDESKTEHFTRGASWWDSYSDVLMLCYRERCPEMDPDDPTSLPLSGLDDYGFRVVLEVASIAAPVPTSPK